MNLFRKTAFAATSTVLIAAAGAMSGLGSSAAQAYGFSASNEVVTVALDSTETAKIAASPDPKNTRDANVICWQAVQDAFAATPFPPMNDLNCAPALYECAVVAVEAGRSVVTVRFEWLKIECVY